MKKYNNIVLDKDDLQKSLDICIYMQKNINGSDCPQFRRVSHCFHHITFYIKEFIMKEQCKSYLEIGTHYGHSLITNLQSKYESQYMAIDLFQKWDDGTIDNMEKLVNDNIKQFNIYNYNCRVLKGNSTHKDVIEQVNKYFDKGVDLLFIDGDHSYKGVLADFENYFPLVNSGGFIIFDDYLPKINDREAPKAIDYIVSKYKNEIIDIGLVDDLVDVYNLKKSKNLNRKNIDYIIKKI